MTLDSKYGIMLLFAVVNMTIFCFGGYILMAANRLFTWLMKGFARLTHRVSQSE